MEFTRNLSKNLRALRGGKSLVEFSNEIGITKSTLQAIEKEVTTARLDTLELICTKTDVPVSALLGGELSSAQTSILFQMFRGLDWFTELSEAEQQEFLHWAQDTLTLFSKLSNQL